MGGGRGNSGQAFLYASLLFAFCCWAVQLGGLSALHHSCHDAPSSIATYASQHNLTNVAAVFNSLSNFNDEYNYGATPSCSVLFGLQWWLTSVFLFLMLGVGACAASPGALQATGLAWTVVLGITSALLWLFCQRYNAIDWNLTNATLGIWRVLGSNGTLKTRIRVTYAGYILESISAVLLLFGIGHAMFRERSTDAPPPAGAFSTSAAAAAAADPKMHQAV